MSIYDINVENLQGESVSMADYKGKVLLIVNTASKCGLASQLGGLEDLYQKYGQDDFVVLGFPCNQFLGQEPLDGEEIESFCQMNYDVTFPIFAKVKVNGKDAHPLFKELKEASSAGVIKWNYTKFLVDKEGQVVDRFAPTTKPEELTDAIEQLV